jgi:hypothetical protein
MIIRLIYGFIFALLLGLTVGRPAAADQLATPATFVRSLLDAPESERDFGRAKVAVDKFIDPSVDDAATLAEINGMVATVNKMLGTLPPDAAFSTRRRQASAQIVTLMPRTIQSIRAIRTAILGSARSVGGWQR